MSNKRRRSPWPIAGISLSFMGATGAGVTSLFALRDNNKQMLELRDAVFVADESGQGIQPAINALQNHVTAHMNANPPKLGNNSAIQLKYSYDRAKEAEVNRTSTARTDLAQQATVYCEANARNVQLTERAACVSQYISDRPVNEKQIVADLYRYNFVSPTWSADLAGWSLVLAGVLGVLFIVQIAARMIASIIIKD